MSDAGCERSCAPSAQENVAQCYASSPSTSTASAPRRARGFFAWLARQRADFVCLQELKAQAADLTHEMRAPEGFHGCFHYAAEEGLQRRRASTRGASPTGWSKGSASRDIDAEGRYLRADFGKLSRDFALSALGLERRPSAKRRSSVSWNASSPSRGAREGAAARSCICGDWNIAHQEIDLKNWRANQKNSGFLPEERAWLDAGFRRLGLGGRLPPAAPGHDGRVVHLVVEPRPGLGQERRVAHRLPDRHARARGDREAGGDLQGAALLRPRTAHDRLRLQSLE